MTIGELVRWIDASIGAGMNLGERTEIRFVNRPQAIPGGIERIDVGRTHASDRANPDGSRAVLFLYPQE
jgi:hypothetical protein